MDDLIDDFLIETRDNLDALYSGLDLLKQNNTDTKALENCLRAIHTIKGTSSFLDIPEFTHTAHLAENILCNWRDTNTPADINDFNEIYDHIDTLKLSAIEIEKKQIRSHDNKDNSASLSSQPISKIWLKFPVLIEKLNSELNKKIDLKMFGQDTLVEISTLELLKAPLTHMIRNSADHSIEHPEERIAKGKPETGLLLLKAISEDGFLIIEISDDGKGFSKQAIKEKVLAKNLATPQEIEKMSDTEIFDFVFHPGFSTATEVTSVSGRGIGMDIVKHNIKKSGGSLAIQSTENKGAKLIIRIPHTPA